MTEPNWPYRHLSLKKNRSYDDSAQQSPGAYRRRNSRGCRNHCDSKRRGSVLRLMMEYSDNTSSDLILNLAGLPKDTIIAHKTGTVTGYSNDAGIINLPDQQGKLILVVFIKETMVSAAAADAVIAKISKIIFDWVVQEHSKD